MIRNRSGWLALLLVVAAGAASARTDTNLDDAWRKFLDRDTNRPPSYTFPYAQCFARSANAYGLPETLLIAVARGESDFEATARSKADAYGVMQILWPATANDLGIHRLSQLYDPCTNIDAGARYLKELLTRYAGNLHLALAAYNYGPARIPADGRDIPTGAQWYSGYIFRHLGYVMGDRHPPGSGTNRLYSTLGQTTLISFGEAYRAEAFSALMEQGAPGLELDWFRKDVGEFVVVLSYRDQEEFFRSARKLERAGFPLDLPNAGRRRP